MSDSPASAPKRSRDDTAFFARSVINWFDKGCNNLRELSTRGLPVIEQYAEIAAHLMAHRAKIVSGFSSMPFARQHHDFREGSILGSNPQVIIDWGSSYGNGPFLYDLAPFLFCNEENFHIFFQHSDICKNADRKTIDRWLYFATCARFLSFLAYIWELTETERIDDLETFLEYHHQTYKGLLQSQSFSKL